MSWDCVEALGHKCIPRRKLSSRHILAETMVYEQETAVIARRIQEGRIVLRDLPTAVPPMHGHEEFACSACRTGFLGVIGFILDSGIDMNAHVLSAEAHLSDQEAFAVCGRVLVAGMKRSLECRPWRGFNSTGPRSSGCTRTASTSLLCIALRALCRADAVRQRLVLHAGHRVGGQASRRPAEH